jgi:hypothetical protein
MCSTFGECENDSVVPEGSGTPQYANATQTFQYTHGELHEGANSAGSASDPLYLSLWHEIRGLARLPTSTCAVTQRQFFDDFAGSTFGTVWEIKSGSWSIGSGLAVGSWPLSIAISQQANLALTGQVLPSNWVAEATLPAGEPAGKIAMYLNSSNVIHFNFEANNGRAFAQTLKNGSQTITGGDTHDGTVSYSSGANRIAVGKNGTAYTAYVNGRAAYTMSDMLHAGQGVVALGAYGTHRYDDFAVCAH